MPSFYGTDPASRLALTPPEYQTGYHLTRPGDGRLATQLPYGASSQLSAYPDKELGYIDGYGRRSTYAGIGSLTYWPSQQQQQQQPQQQQPPPPPPTTASSYDAYYAPRYDHPQPIYPPIAAPVLPSLPPNDMPPAAAVGTRDRFGHRQGSLPELSRVETAPPKEEKPVGGVAAYLDYEMDDMVAFVADMAQRIVQSSAPVSPAFRKFVSQILSSTRLPRSTILLALHYLAARMRSLSPRDPHCRTSSGQVYRMLTVALLLGSKFLDDNTFQNRSWSDVSGLPVVELNALEREWLRETNWHLHVDPLDDDGFLAMSQQWRRWMARGATVSTAASRLAPLDTSVSHAPSRHEVSPRYRNGLPSARDLIATSESGHRAYATRNPYDSAWGYGPGPLDYSPPSAPETGPSTPDYGLYPWSYGAAPPPYASHPSLSMASQASLYHRAPYQQPYASNIWGNNHRAGCGCTYCVRPHDPYSMSQGYGPQSVAS